jgi:hypothetical protein
MESSSTQAWELQILHALMPRFHDISRVKSTTMIKLKTARLMRNPQVSKAIIICKCNYLDSNETELTKSHVQRLGEQIIN